MLLNIVIAFLLIFNPLTISASPVAAKHAMVVTEQSLASQVGIDILKKGGNAIDAAVAVGYALAVVNPCCGNLGGGGFMTLHLANGKNIFINFRERAPLAINVNLFLDKTGVVIPGKTTEGYLAVATPGTVLGLDTALKKYGTLTRQTIMAPAIRLADQGFILREGDNINRRFKIGDKFVQKDLANTLKQISAKGPDVFYKGPIAKTIVEESHKHGGVLSLKDFASYTVEERAPVYCAYHGNTIISAPLPSSGGTVLCEMLNILEKPPLEKEGFHSALSASATIQAMKRAFHDRNSLGDGVDTTHYSVVDQFGNAVSVTYTLNSFFGAKVIAGNTGFYLNDEIDDFTIQPNTSNKFGLVQGEANLIKPGKRPLSSMTPTIITKDNKLLMVLGSPGGPRIITSVLQTILNVLDYKMDIQSAVDAPRFHNQWLPDTTYMEPETFTPKTLKQLQSWGYHLTPNPPWSAVEAIYIDQKNNTLYGGCDKRRIIGKAIGY